MAAQRVVLRGGDRRPPRARAHTGPRPLVIGLTAGAFVAGALVGPLIWHGGARTDPDRPPSQHRALAVRPTAPADDAPDIRLYVDDASAARPRADAAPSVAAPSVAAPPVAAPPEVASAPQQDLAMMPPPDVSAAPQPDVAMVAQSSPEPTEPVVHRHHRRARARRAERETPTEAPPAEVVKPRRRPVERIQAPETDPLEPAVATQTPPREAATARHARSRRAAATDRPPARDTDYGRPRSDDYIWR